MSDDKNNEAISVLAKLISRQGTMINLAMHVISDQMIVLEQLLEKCSRCDDDIVTVQHKYTQKRVCDHCAAEMIYFGLKNVLKDADVTVNLENEYSIINEKNWIDVENADKLRKIADYVKVLKELEVKQDEIH